VLNSYFINLGIKNKSTLKVLGFILLFCVFFPTLTMQQLFKPIKLPFIGAALILFFLIISIKKSIGAHKITFVLFAIYLFKGIYGAISGIVQGAPGVYVNLSLNVTYVIVYFMFICLLHKHQHFKWVVNIMAISAAVLLLFDLYYILQFFNLVPKWSIYDWYKTQNIPFGIGISQYNTLEFNARNTSTFAFFFPFFSALLFNKKQTNISLLNNKWILSLLCILIFILLVLTGRRIFYLIILLTPILIFFLSRFLEKKQRRLIGKGIKKLFILTPFLLIPFFGYLSTNFGLDLESIYESFLSAFDSKVEGERFNQSEALLNSWRKSPIFGHGLGAAVDGYVRIKTVPWAFEMGFHKSLHSLGLIGFGLEFSYYIGIIIIGIKIIKETNDIVMIGLLAGFISFLLGNATNPFINSYEFLWPLFLPLLYINIKLLNKRIVYENR